MEGITTSVLDGNGLDPVEIQGNLWLFMSAVIIFGLMQAGFALLEVGSVREKHRKAVLAKNLLDSATSPLSLWLYAELARPSFILGGGGVIPAALLLFQAAFCATAVTITSGSMAERPPLVTYLVYTVPVAGFVWPVVADSAWGTGGGLLEPLFKLVPGHPYHDFAGSGVVHLLGGVSAFAGNWLQGRRLAKRTGAVNPRRRPRKGDDPREDADEFAVENKFVVVGTFLLWFAWFFFNAGSTQDLDGRKSLAIGHVAWNTFLASAGGMLGAYVHCCFERRKGVDVPFLCNGALAGLVSITAACAVVNPPLALLAGVLAGSAVFPFTKRLLEKTLLLDDPVDAIAVHAGCGLWGVLFVAFATFVCVDEDGMEEQQRFCDGSTFWSQLAAQSLGALAISCWTWLWSFPLFFLFMLSERVRAEEVEDLGEAISRMDAEIARRGGAEAGSHRVTDEEMKAIVGRLWKVQKQSPLVRMTLQDALRKETFTLEQIKVDLTNVKVSMAESALEEPSAGVRHLVKFLHRRRLRYWAMLRLRIPPGDELDGRVTADVDLLGLVVRDLRAWISEEARERLMRRYDSGPAPSGSVGGLDPEMVGLAGSSASDDPAAAGETPSTSASSTPSGPPPLPLSAPVGPGSAAPPPLAAVSPSSAASAGTPLAACLGSGPELEFAVHIEVSPEE